MSEPIRWRYKTECGVDLPLDPGGRFQHVSGCVFHSTAGERTCNITCEAIEDQPSLRMIVERLRVKLLEFDGQLIRVAWGIEDALKQERMACATLARNEAERIKHDPMNLGLGDVPVEVALLRLADRIEAREG